MVSRRGCLATAAAFLLLTLAPPAPATNATGRYVVSFVELPDGIEKDSPLYGGWVLRVDRALGFAVVMVDDVGRFLDAAARDPVVRHVAADSSRFSLQAVPDDPLYPQQYGPVQVRAPEAWDSGWGSHERNVCIIDTGVRYSHEDLEANYVGGWDFVDDDDTPWDGRGHGTHVAGTVAAGVNNAVGVAGMGNVGILAVRVFNDHGYVWDSDIASALAWCADHEGHVISMSLGAYSPDPWTPSGIEYAWRAGSLLVAAAGNSGCDDCIIDPANRPQVIAVTCTDALEQICLFSSTGPEAGLAAPGSQILSTCYESDSAYCAYSGTSMSTPHVSGVAALVWSHRPSLRNCEIRDILNATAADRGDPGWDHEYGHGIVDAKAALDLALKYEPSPDGCEYSDARIRWVAPALGADMRGVEEIAVEARPGHRVPQAVDAYLDGEFLAALDGPDDNGRFHATYDTQETTRGTQISMLEARATYEDGTTDSVGSNHTINNAFQVEILSPWIGENVVGNVTVQIRADSLDFPIESVRFQTEDGTALDVTDSFDGANYWATWDSTEHWNESDPWETLRVDAAELGGQARYDTTVVEVDNKPAPTIAFPPATLGMALPKHRILVDAASQVGEDLRVTIQVNGRPPIDISTSRFLGHFYYDWDSLGEPEVSVIRAEAADSGGLSWVYQAILVPTSLVPLPS